MGVHWYGEAVAAEGWPGERPPWHEREMTPPAPGELDLVRSFLSLHDHQGGGTESFPPSPATLEWWLRDCGLLGPDEPATAEDLRWTLEVLEALRSLVRENAGLPSDPAAAPHLDAVAGEVGLRPRFGGPGGLVPSVGGVRGAVGRVLAVAFLARVEGTWRNLKPCASPECRSVFYDRSRNHSGRWCRMDTCGNRMKVRAWRARRRGR